MGVTSVSISSIKMIAGEFSQANWKMSASGGTSRMFTSAFECWWATTQEVVWLWREACAGIKKVYARPIINSRNFRSGDQCSRQAHKISA